MHSAAAVALMPLFIFCCAYRSWDSQCFYWAVRPPKLPLSLGVWTPSNTWFLWSIRVTHPNGISISSAVFVGHIHDQHTNSQITLRAAFVAIGRIYAKQFVKRESVAYAICCICNVRSCIRNMVIWWSKFAWQNRTIKLQVWHLSNVIYRRYTHVSVTYPWHAHEIDERNRLHSAIFVSFCYFQIYLISTSYLLGFCTVYFEWCPHSFNVFVHFSVYYK